MKSPFTGGEVIRQTHNEELEFRGEKFTIPYSNYKCVDSGKEFTTSEIDELNLQMLYNAYRRKHHIPFPDEIKSIREGYGVNQTKMAMVLGFGVNTYRNYENGNVPELANAKLISLASNPEGFIQLVKACDDLSDKEEKKFIQNAENFQSAGLQWTFSLFKYLHPEPVTGYRSPSFYKLSAMVNYLSNDIEPFTTKLNKLLFYADFLHFKMHGYSISGISYQAIQNGPVPHRYGILYEYGSEQGSFFTKVIQINDGEGTQFISNPNFDVNKYLSKSELECIQVIKEELGGLKTQELIDISHKEKGWLDNESEQGIIDYSYALMLKYPE